MNALCTDIIESVIEPLLTWKESSNLCSCNKYLNIVLKNHNSRSNKEVIAKNEINIMNQQIKEITNAQNYVIVLQRILNLYSRMEYNKDIYLRLPCLTVAALAQLSRISCENSEITELQQLKYRLQTIYSYTNGILLYSSLSRDFTETTTCAYNPGNGPCILHGNACKKKWSTFLTHHYPILYLTP